MVGSKEILKISGYRTITKPVPRLAPIPIMGAARAPYSGSSRKFILALDIGTTFSGAAYTLLDPGRPVPQIRYNIARVSSILYYDHDGNFRGVENGVDLQDSDTLVRMKW